MAITTGYGTWRNTVDQNRSTVEDTVTDVFGTQGPDGYDLAAIVSDYRDAINQALPDGVWLEGNDFYGPVWSAPHDWPADVDIQTIVNKIDVMGIIRRHRQPQNESAAR